jgi:hydroxyacylglutathione hydrolase
LFKILPISALIDNYIWLVTHTENQAIIIDPSDAVPVFDACQQYNLKPCAMLITHDHWDHINGMAAIYKAFEIPIYSATKIQLLPTTPICDKQVLNINDLLIKVIALKGHTKTHVAYLVRNHLFCGDVLFPGACGKVEDNLYHEMYHSLLKISKLKHNTRIYSGHEYTVSTLKFALRIDPSNRYLEKRLKEAELKIAQGQPTLPVLLSDELKTNPFLRCADPVIKKKVESLTHQQLHSTEAVFTALRQWKTTHG